MEKLFRTEKPPFRNVIIVSENEGHARVDRETAKNLGADVHAVFTRGTEAREYLAENPVDMVIIDRRLADMDGCAFMRELRADPALEGVPIVMAALENTDIDVLDAIASGCSGYLLRPYTIGSFERQTRRARRVSRLPQEVSLWAARTRDARLSRDLELAAREGRISVQRKPARTLYQEGKRHLVAERYTEAVEAFRLALRENDTYAEAYEGLARACFGQNDRDRYLLLLRKAATQYALQDRYMEVKALFLEIVQMGGCRGKAADNPFLSIGNLLWGREEHEEAILAWRRALQLTPDEPEVILTLARAYLYTEATDQAMLVLEAALERDPEMEEVGDFYDHLLGIEPETWMERWLNRMDNWRETMKTKVVGKLLRPRSDFGDVEDAA